MENTLHFKHHIFIMQGKEADISGIKAFKATYPNQKIMPGLVIHAGSERYLLDADTIAIPWHFNPVKF